MTTLKFLLFAGAFVAILGALLPLISETAGGTTELVEYAEGSSSTLYVMAAPANHVKTMFALNPKSAIPIDELDVYLYADHDVTLYYDSTENYFTLYFEIVNPITTYSQTDNIENFNPSTMSKEFGASWLENINLSWAENHNIIIEVEDDRALGAGNVYWTFPVTVRAYEVRTGEGERHLVLFFHWLWDGANYVGGAVASVISSVLTAVVGADIANMVSSFMTNVGRIMTMNFGGIPEILRLMIAAPIWMGIGYVMLIIIRSFLPTIGGGSQG